jgi:hypothetical protein
MGFVDEPGLPAVDGLMRAVFEHARQVLWVRDAAFRRFLERDAPPSAPPPADPEALLAALADLAETGGAPSVRRPPRCGLDGRSGRGDRVDRHDARRVPADPRGR